MSNTVILSQVFYSDFSEIGSFDITSFSHLRIVWTSAGKVTLHKSIFGRLTMDNHPKDSSVLTGLLLGLFFLIQESRSDSQLLKFPYQIPTLMHLKKNIAAANKLTVEEHLRNRRPVGESLYSFQEKQSHMLVFNNFYMLKVIVLPKMKIVSLIAHPHVIQNL